MKNVEMYLYWISCFIQAFIAWNCEALAQSLEFYFKNKKRLPTHFNSFTSLCTVIGTVFHPLTSPPDIHRDFKNQ